MTALGKQVGGSHYKDMPIQPIEFIVKNNLDWYQGNIIKYAARHHNKGGAADLRKVIHYAELALEAQYSEVADTSRADIETLEVENRMLRERNTRLEAELAVLTGGRSCPAPQPPWYPEKPPGYGRWIERKDGDPIPLLPHAQVFALSAKSRAQGLTGSAGRAAAFNWYSTPGNTNYICAYCVKEGQQ